jgi:phage-related protein
MTTRTYDYILTIDNPSVINKGDTILSNITSTTGTVVSTDKANSNIKVKVSNVFQEFVVGENVAPVFNRVSSNVEAVTYTNTASLSVNSNSFQINGTTNTFSLPLDVLNRSNLTSDSFSVFVNNRLIDKSLINYPSSTLGDTGFDFKPIRAVTSGDTHTQDSLRLKGEEESGIYDFLLGSIADTFDVSASNSEFTYSIGYENWIHANLTSVVVRADEGNNESIPFQAKAFSDQVIGSNALISAVNNSNYIKERNAFVQNPLVRLYTIYYPGEWYPANPNGNPTGEGEGRRWPDGFPLRFAEVRGDLNTDVTYNVEFGGINYTPMPINSGGIDIDSSGTINEVTVDISNFDGLITQLCENPDLVGNNTSNACFAVVNGEVVTGIDPRTIPTGATYTEQEHTDVLSRARSNGLTFNQTVRDSYGVDNASFTVNTTEAVDGTWKREKMDSRDLLGGVVEIQSTFANFLDYWPEYSKVRSAYSNVLEMTTTLPYRVGDEVFVRANTFVATIQAIEEERFIFTNTALTLGQGDHLLIKNADADDEAYVEDNFKIDSLQNLDERVAQFSLTSWLQFFKLILPRRKYYKNTCQWIYKGEECQYPGPAGGTIPGTTLTANTNPIAANNQTAGSIGEDECGKSFESCQIRNNTVHFGGFPGTGRTIPK